MRKVHGNIKEFKGFYWRFSAKRRGYHGIGLIGADSVESIK
jgi:hypothetical protein